MLFRRGRAFATLASISAMPRELPVDLDDAADMGHKLGNAPHVGQARVGWHQRFDAA